MERFKYLYVAIYFFAYLSSISLYILIAFIIWTEPSLHEPMYIFIFNLMINGVFGITAFIPKLLIYLISGSVTISKEGCLLQAFCIQSSACIDNLLFTIMAYDRYLAVGFPLRYPTLMTNGKTYKFIATIWIVILITQAPFVAGVASLPMCDITINSVFCDTMSLMKMSCGGSPLFNIFGGSMTFIQISFSISIIFYCYIRTFVICLRISGDASLKAIHTLVTHLIAFSIFTVSIVFIALRYRVNNVSLSNTVYLAILMTGVSIFLTANPFIFGLRMEALRIKIFKKIKYI
ncbi:olfactory receptor-like protein COR1 [Pelobates fuscus]|uniref:olfactory receptor-like protein COR1 n=1 Tax=Pelobates fuscus TaxID=191477 RepID=UPI002FE4F4CD